MTSCKPPPTCIDASPIPDANDSRMSAIPYEANLTPMGASPLRYSTRHPQPRSRGRGPGVDAGGDGEAWADAQRGQDLGEGRPQGELRLPWLHVRPAALPEGWPLVLGRKPVQAECAAAQDEGGRSPGERQQSALARSA